MPIHCPNLPKEVVTKLNHDVSKLPISHPLKKESQDGDVTIFVDNSCAVYHSAGGFYFHRIQTSLEETIQKDIHNVRPYMCTPFEIQPPYQETIQKLLSRFQEICGQKYSNMIDHHAIQFGDNHLLLVQFPSCVVRQMMCKSGGTFRTVLRGPTESLKQIPTLVRLGKIQEEEENAVSLFVTQFTADSYQNVTTIHYDLLREVVNKPNLGICVNPFLIWDP